MTIIESLVAVLGEFPAEYHFLLYGFSLMVFIMFMDWIFNTIFKVLTQFIFGKGA